ncbi:MAG: hypothetical protein ABSA53_00140 [Streptosporangiaceae bacterium]|jgi:hypothetical protein
MIKSDTYLADDTAKRNLLAAFTSADLSISKHMSTDDIDAQFIDLINRAVMLVSYHGHQAVQRFAADLASGAPQDCVAMLSSYLEVGGWQQPLPAQQRSWVSNREMQQEILHFSRIVEVPREAIGTDGLGLTNKRLRNSRDIPVSLKILTELITVVRSRHQGRGMQLASPHFERRDPSYTRLSDECSVISDRGSSGYLLLVRSPMKRPRRELAYLFSNLLSYLTPDEALRVLWLHLSENRTSLPVDLALAEALPTGGVRITEVRYDVPHDPGDYAWLAPGALVEGRAEALPRLGASLGVRVEDGRDHSLQIRVCGAVASHDVTLESRHRSDAAPGFDPAEFLDRIAPLGEVRSIEFGHIHLDRDLDIDQEVGTVLGAQVWKSLCHRQSEAPHLTPMIDDDHVLIRLRPQMYEEFLRSKLPDATYYLIPESSPVIRAIVVALFQRARDTSFGDHLVEGGSNLYVEIDETTTCELFEDFHGRCDTGCVFFEMGLLLFRSDPDRFLGEFADLYPDYKGIHKIITDIHNRESAHDEMVDAVAELNQNFQEVINPHLPESPFRAVVDEVINESKGYVHINVLEDYYEAQQRKVWALIKMLGLPVRLVSLHFNARSGRLSWDLG